MCDCLQTYQNILTIVITIASEMLPVMQSYDIELVATYPTGLDICMQFCIFFLYSATKIDVFFTKSIQNLETSQGYIFHILQHFVTKLWNFTNFVPVTLNFVHYAMGPLERNQQNFVRKSYLRSLGSLALPVEVTESRSNNGSN